MNKITKREMFTALVQLGQTGELFFENSDGERVDVSAEQLVEFATGEIGLIDRKNEKAKERAEKKRLEGDELSAAIEAVLTDEMTSIADIVAKVGDPDVSVAKAQFRLSNLFKAGKASKGTITIPGGEGTKSRTIVGYALPTED